MQGLVVGGMGLPHLPEDFDPAVGQAAEGGGVGLAVIAFVLVIRLSPSAFVTALVGPMVEGRAQGRIAGKIGTLTIYFPSLPGRLAFLRPAAGHGADAEAKLPLQV
jgi:hypothetical protein